MYVYKIMRDIPVNENKKKEHNWLFLKINLLAVMMAAVIDITNDEQRQVVRRLFRESGNVNVKTPAVCFLFNFNAKHFFFGWF